MVCEILVELVFRHQNTKINFFNILKGIRAQFFPCSDFLKTFAAVR